MHSKRRCPSAHHAAAENVTGSGYNVRMQTPPRTATATPPPAGTPVGPTQPAEPATQPAEPAPQPAEPATQPAEPGPQPAELAPQPARPATPQWAEPAKSRPDAGVLPLVPSFGRPPGARRPLPDAVAVRRLVVPDSAPPYDDELRVISRPGHVPQGAGPPQSPGLAAAGTAQAGKSQAGKSQAGKAHTGESQSGAAQTGAAAPGEDQASAACWPGQFAQVLAETLAGSRPPRQITPWTTEQARRHIRELGPLLAVGHRPQVRRVVTSSPAADVVEMTAVVTFGPKIRALAVRLERNGAQGARPGRCARPARWLCTAVEAA